jgi:hypothetical protein
MVRDCFQFVSVVAVLQLTLLWQRGRLAVAGTRISLASSWLARRPEDRLAGVPWQEYPC